MRRKIVLAGLVAALAVSSSVRADETSVRNYGASASPEAPSATYQAAPPMPVVGSTATVTTDDPAATVAFGHRRGCKGCGGGSGISYGAYGTYQPAYYGAGYYGRYPYGAAYGNGYYGMYPYGTMYGNYNSAYVYSTPNPYGYYPNGQLWGSSGSTYMRPFPVWDSPSGYYGYRYNGWGSYGWGGWGGTGPAGWGYQGGFYW